MGRSFWEWDVKRRDVLENMHFTVSDFFVEESHARQAILAAPGTLYHGMIRGMKGKRTDTKKQVSSAVGCVGQGKIKITVSRQESRPGGGFPN